MEEMELREILEKVVYNYSGTGDSLYSMCVSQSAEELSPAIVPAIIAITVTRYPQPVAEQAGARR